MMKVLQVSVIATMVVLLSGCGGTQACRDTQPYERSRPGRHVEVPEGLDPLNSQRELTIPEPSPRPPRAANSPCLEVPPTFRIEEEQTVEDEQGSEDPDDS